jgi:hypothetical protein
MTINSPEEHYVIQATWTHFDFTKYKGDGLYMWDQFTFADGSIWLTSLYGLGQTNDTDLEGSLAGIGNRTMTTMNPTLRLRFHTSTNLKTGFGFRFTSIPRPSYYVGGPSLTTLPIVAQAGTLTSYNYPGTYPSLNKRAFFSAPPGLQYSITMSSFNLLPGDTLIIYTGPFSATDVNSLRSDSYLSQYPSQVFSGSQPGYWPSFNILASQFVVEFNPQNGGSGPGFAFSFNVFNPTSGLAYQNEASNVIRFSTSTLGSTTTVSQTSSGSNNNTMYALVSLVALPVLVLAVAIVIVKRRKMQQQKVDQQFYDPQARMPGTKLERRVPSDMESPEFCPVTHDMASPEIGPGFPSTPLPCARNIHTINSDPRIRVEV